MFVGPEPHLRTALVCAYSSCQLSPIPRYYTSFMDSCGWMCCVCVACLVTDFDVSSTFRTSKIDDVFSTYFCYEDKLTHVHVLGRSLRRKLTSHLIRSTLIVTGWTPCSPEEKNSWIPQTVVRIAFMHIHDAELQLHHVSVAL